MKEKLINAGGIKLVAIRRLEFVIWETQNVKIVGASWAMHTANIIICRVQLWICK